MEKETAFAIWRLVTTVQIGCILLGIWDCLNVLRDILNEMRYKDETEEDKI